KERGEALLNQARMELRRGETGNARRLAEEAFSGPYGVQADAEKLLRTIGVEEYNQKVLAEHRSLEAAQAAYQRKEYAQAATIVRTIDKQMLPADQQLKLRELMQAPEMQRYAVAQASHQAEAPGRSRATDQAAAPAEGDALAQVKTMQKVKFDQLRQEGLRVQREANASFQAGETDKALEMLRDYTVRIRDSQLEPEDVTKLRRPIETQVQRLTTLKSRKD